MCFLPQAKRASGKSSELHVGICKFLSVADVKMERQEASQSRSWNSELNPAV